MSTLRVTDIESNGTGFNDVISFKNASGTENGTLCRAWVNFDGTFGTSPFTESNGGIRGAFNVSSVTDNSVGDYTVNITNALSHANYSVSCSLRTVISSAATAQIKSTSSLTTTSFTVICFTTAGNFADSPEIFASVFS